MQQQITNIRALTVRLHCRPTAPGSYHCSPLLQPPAPTHSPFLHHSQNHSAIVVLFWSLLQIDLLYIISLYFIAQLFPHLKIGLKASVLMLVFLRVPSLAYLSFYFSHTPLEIMLLSISITTSLLLQFPRDIPSLTSKLN